MSRLPVLPSNTEGPDRRPGWLADGQRRHLRYLRLSVTDRCDLRCVYCMPATGVAASPREQLLDFSEIVRLVQVFSRLGVQTVRLTGGEPLVRRGLPELVRRLRDEAGISDIALTTNATALAQHASALVDAGIKRINVSVDSVNPETFATLTRGGDFSRVQRGIDAARDAGIPEMKTNTVVVRGANHTELDEVVRWAWDRDITPRFIELMPLGEAAHLGREAVISVEEMKSGLRGLIDQNQDAEPRLDRGPASYLPSLESPDRKVGFIGAVTENFCDRCNRVRVTAKGQIRACLASPEGLSVRDLLRQHEDNRPVEEAIRLSLFGAAKDHEFYVSGATAHHDVHMSRIGG